MQKLDAETRFWILHPFTSTLVEVENCSNRWCIAESKVRLQYANYGNVEMFSTTDSFSEKRIINTDSD